MEYTIQLIKLLFIIFIFTYGLYLALKFIKKKQYKKVSENKLMNIVDGIQLGMNQAIYIVKVGEEYVLLTMGSGGVDMMSLNQKEFSDSKVKFEELLNSNSPKEKLLNLKNTVKEGFGKK